MHDVFLTNTLTKEKSLFKPIKAGEVSLYSCGPTVYDYAHIGNFRSFLMADILTRVLTYAGYKVNKVQNITDVGHLTGDDVADAEGEDKIAKKAKATGEDAFAIARKYEDYFIEDEAILRILPPSAGRPRATDFIAEQIKLTEQLIEQGFAYEIGGSVYFRTAQFEDYGKLSGNKVEALDAGSRVEVNSDKEHPADFALWKFAEPEHLMQWDSPWGRGFPGWHIECSAMSQKLLGDNFDIHTGGEDNIFPHHECEIAQNECSHGGTINYWLHGKHLLVDGTKMSKSKGNFYTIRDLLDKGWKGNEIRYALMAAHYRTSLNFTDKSLQDARASIDRITEARRIFQHEADDTIQPAENPAIQALIDKYQKALFDDLNVPDALAAVFELINYGHKNKTPETAYLIALFLDTDFDKVFDIFPAAESLDEGFINEIDTLIEQRNQARVDKDWATADRIRDELAAKNIELIDENGVTSWKQV